MTDRPWGGDPREDDPEPYDGPPAPAAGSDEPWGPGSRYPDDGRPAGEPPGNPPDDSRPEWLIPVIAAALALFLGLVLGWILWAGGDDPAGLQEEVDALTAENAELRSQVDDLTAQLEDPAAGDRLAELTAENEELTAQVESLTEEVEGLTTDNAELTEQVTALEEENARLEERIEEILADLDASVVAVPDLVGGTADDAAAQARENGWLLVQIPTATAGVAPGTVVAQTPLSGTPMLSGSVLVVSVAAAPEPAPEPGLDTVFEAQGSGSTTTDAVDLPGGTRHVLAYSFSGDGRHTVTVVDADGNPVAVLVDVNGTSDGATGLPLAGSYRLQVDTQDGVDWELRVLSLP